MSDSPEYVADYLMTKLLDATADLDSEYRKACLLELKRLCKKELVNHEERELDRKLNPQFYT